MNKNLITILKTINIILICLIILGIICTIFPLCFGHIGIAINGKIENDVYYLGMGGKLDQVSRIMFIISALGTLLAPVCTTLIAISYPLSTQSKINSMVNAILGYTVAVIVGGGFFLISFFVLLFAILGINYCH